MHMMIRTQNIQPPDAQRTGLAMLMWAVLLLLLLVLGCRQVISFLAFAQKDVGIYYDAAMALRTGEDMFGAYGQAPLTYIYPPLLAILFMPLTYLDLNHAAAVWTVVNVILLFGCLWGGGRLLITRFGARLDSATLPVLMVVSMLVFIARIESELDQGQVDFLVLLGVIGALALLRRHPFLAGCLLGFVANIKYQTVIFLPYFALRGWWNAAFGLVLAAVAVALSGSLVLGWELNLDYLSRSFSSLGGLIGLPPGEGPQPFIYPMDWQDSISLTSVFSRLTGGEGASPGLLYLLIGASAAGCAGLGWWLHLASGRTLFRGRHGAVGRTDESLQSLIAMEWIGLLVAALVFAPQTKMRHLALLLLMVMLMVLLLLVRREGVPRLPLLIALCIMSLVLVLPPPMTDALHDMRKSFRTSGIPILGVLAAFFVMLWTGLRWSSTSGAASSSEIDDPVDEMS